MSDFHGRIMNIQCDNNEPVRLNLASITLIYRHGHKSARHAAAEIANEADAAIAAKDAEIANLQAAITEQVERRDAEIARMRDALTKIAAYPRERSDEMGVAVLRQLARAALAGGGA